MASAKSWSGKNGWMWPPNNGPRALYYDATRYYGQPDWTPAELASKRLRMTIRFIALEEACVAKGLSGLPSHVLKALKVLSDYQEAQKPKAYRSRRHPQGRPRVPSPYDHLQGDDVQPRELVMHEAPATGGAGEAEEAAG